MPRNSSYLLMTPSTSSRNKAFVEITILPSVPSTLLLMEGSITAASFHVLLRRFTTHYRFIFLTICYFFRTLFFFVWTLKFEEDCIFTHYWVIRILIFCIWQLTNQFKDLKIGCNSSQMRLLQNDKSFPNYSRHEGNK